MSSTVARVIGQRTKLFAAIGLLALVAAVLALGMVAPSQSPSRSAPGR